MPRRIPAASRSEAGVSLIEILVSLGLLGALSLLVLPNVPRLTGKYRANDAARQHQSALQLARMRSISERTSFVAKFSGRTFNYFPDVNKNGIQETSERNVLLAPIALPPNFRYEYPPGASTAEAAASAAVTGCKCFRFQTNGLVMNAQSGPSRSFAIGDGKEYRRITVSNGGAVSIERWNGSQWE